MAETQQISPQKQDSLFRVLMLTSFKTLYFLLLFLAVLAVTISQCFPFSAAKFFYQNGNFAAALPYAKISAQRQGKNSGQAVLYGLEMSENLFFHAKTDKEKQANAEYLDFFAEKLIFADNFGTVCADMDEYFQAKAHSLIEKIGLYSYQDYVLSASAAARAALGKDGIYYDGSFTQNQAGFISSQQLEGYFFDLFEGDYLPAGPSELATLFAQLSQNLASGGDLLFSNGAVTLTYDFLVLSIAGEGSSFDFVSKAAECTNKVEMLYLINSALNLQDALETFFDQNNQTAEKERLETYFVANIDGQTMPLYDFFAQEYEKLLDSPFLQICYPDNW